MDFVDIHNHVLPGVDDGPRDLDATIALLAAAWQTGVRRIVATPHRFLPPWSNADTTELRRAFDRLQAAVAEKARTEESEFLGQMRLHLGAENHLSSELLSALENGDVLTLNGGRYVLIELPEHMPLDPVISALRLFRGRGLHPVVAHVERCGFFHERSANRALDRLVDLGCILQVNAESLLDGRRRDPLRARCLDLLRHDVVRVVASDAHSATSRRPLLDAAYEVLRREIPEDRAVAIVLHNPAAILDDRPQLGSV